MNISPVKGIYPMCKDTFFTHFHQVVLKIIYICHKCHNHPIQHLRHALTA